MIKAQVEEVTLIIILIIFAVGIILFIFISNVDSQRYCNETYPQYTFQIANKYEKGYAKCCGDFKRYDNHILNETKECVMINWGEKIE